MTVSTGSLDHPRPEHESVPGTTLEIGGWVVFDGRPADRIEVLVGDLPPQVARRCLPRLDVVDALGLADAVAVGCGFTSTVPLSRDLSGSTQPVHVRAWSESGHAWTTSTEVVVGETVEWPDAYVPTDLRVPDSSAPSAGPLRIAVFTHSMHIGGGELYLDELLRRMDEEYDVELLVISPAGGVMVERLRERGTGVHVTHPYPVHPHHYDGGIRELQHVLTSWGAEAVIANTAGVFPGVDAALELDLPVIWAIHESFALEEFITLNWGERGLHPEVEARFRHTLSAAHTVFEAEATLDLYASQLPSMRARHVHYGIDVAEITDWRAAHDPGALRAEAGIAADDVVLLCMGVIQERKAQLALVLAFADLARRFPRARLVLVGGHPSPYSLAVEQAVKDLGLDDRVDVHPIQPDIYRWYAMADVLVSASDIESLPRSILEAKAFGLPTLATDVFGLSEIIADGVNGWLCRSNSGNALTVGLQRALAAPGDERARMAQACLDEAPGYDGRGYAEAYYRLAHGLADTRRLTRATVPEEGSP